MNALDAWAERQDPILRIAVLHDVADAEMGLQRGGLVLVDDLAQLELVEQKFVPDIFRIEDHLGALSRGYDFAKGLRDAIPGVLRADLERRARTEARRINKERAATGVARQL